MIQVQNLSFTYPGGEKPTLKQLNFEIGQGEIFGFLGPSGAGKSTTQKILTGALKGYEGEVRVFGRDLSGWGNDYYERIGVSFESPNHYLKLSAVENLEYFRSLYSGETEKAAALLELVGLGEEGDLSVSRFSKGMKNRLTLARSLLNRPDLLFLDEPTAGLDPGNVRRVLDIVRGVRERGATVFLTTHDMVNGEIRLVDSPRELKIRHGSRSVRVAYLEGEATAAREFPLSGLRHNGDFLEILEGERVETIHTRETTLARIFIEVTGESLGE